MKGFPILLVLSGFLLGSSTPKTGAAHHHTRGKYLGARPIPPSKATTYRFEDARKRETLRVVYLGQYTLRFQLTALTKATGATATLAGLARMAPEAIDPEIDSDEQGMAYPANEFRFGDECGLSIRIDAETRRLAKVFAAACPQKSRGGQATSGFDCRRVMRVVK
jgi:hypothetical protein